MRKPLIVYGARQVGKTTSIRQFGKSYRSFIEINFITMPEFKAIFAGSLRVDDVIKEASLLNPQFQFIPGDTLILFDEIQECPNAATFLKPAAEDGRFDVVCSGSSLGISYRRLVSVPVGFKEEYRMYSLDFEEFLWANGYDDELTETLFSYMKKIEKLPAVYMDKLSRLYRDYIFVGGMPEAAAAFVETGLFSAAFAVQKRIYKDYEDDVTKYVVGLNAARVKNVYRHITPQLAKDNHKFQISKLGRGARSREYVGVIDWLKDAGIINVAYNVEALKFPFSAYEKKDYFRLYYADHSLFIANLDDEAKRDLIVNRNYDIYNGALYENLVSEALAQAGYALYFYKSDDATTELDFLTRVKNSIVPLEVKRNRGRSKSLRAVVENRSARLGVKLTRNNIGVSGDIITFPYFLTFLLKRFFAETDIIRWDD